MRRKTAVLVVLALVALLVVVVPSTTAWASHCTIGETADLNPACHRVEDEVNKLPGKIDQTVAYVTQTVNGVQTYLCDTWDICF